MDVLDETKHIAGGTQEGQADVASVWLIKTVVTSGLGQRGHLWLSVCLARVLAARQSVVL